MSTERYAREDVTMHGVTIPRGEMTLGVIGSANRDETVFQDADRLDLAREPNRHLSFGQGIHFCLGAPLARLEAQIAIDTLLRRIPNLRLKVSPDSLRWRPSMILRGLDALPVVFQVSPQGSGMMASNQQAQSYKLVDQMGSRRIRN